MSIALVALLHLACAGRPPSPEVVTPAPPAAPATSEPRPEVPRAYPEVACATDADCMLDPGFPCDDSPCGRCPSHPTSAVHREARASAEAACTAWRDALASWEAARAALPTEGPALRPPPPNCGPCAQPEPARFHAAACHSGVCTPVAAP